MFSIYKVIPSGHITSDSMVSIFRMSDKQQVKVYNINLKMNGFEKMDDIWLNYANSFEDRRIEPTPFLCSPWRLSVDTKMEKGWRDT